MSRIERKMERHREREMRGSLDLGRKDAERRRCRADTARSRREDLDVCATIGQDAERGLLVVLRENLVDIDGLRFFPDVSFLRSLQYLLKCYPEYRTELKPERQAAPVSPTHAAASRSRSSNTCSHTSAGTVTLGNRRRIPTTRKTSRSTSKALRIIRFEGQRRRRHRRRLPESSPPSARR